MNNGGDAAEQIVRLSLEGFEVAAKLTGSAAKNVALLLVSVLKQEQQTKGKALKKKEVLKANDYSEKGKCRHRAFLRLWQQRFQDEDRRHGI